MCKLHKEHVKQQSLKHILYFPRLLEPPTTQLSAGVFQQQAVLRCRLGWNMFATEQLHTDWSVSCASYNRAVCKIWSYSFHQNCSCSLCEKTEGLPQWKTGLWRNHLLSIENTDFSQSLQACHKDIFSGQPQLPIKTTYFHIIQMKHLISFALLNSATASSWCLVKIVVWQLHTFPIDFLSMAKAVPRQKLHAP